MQTIDSIFADPGFLGAIHPTADQLVLNRALATRTLTPDEPTLRRAADWLQILFSRLPTQQRAAYLDSLAEKSALLIRLAHRHVPALARDLESPASPLLGIEFAARFLPDRGIAFPGETDNDPALITLRHSLAALDLPPTPPPGSDPTWHENRRRLQQLILHDNPHRFLTWPVIQNSMFMNDPTIAAPELAALESQPDFATRWLPALHEDALGAPARSHLLPTSSNNLIHHAFNLLQLELTGLRINSLTSILEFGGGYGSTARLAHRLGFRGHYFIFDLPEFSALQRFYLTSLQLPIALNHSSTGNPPVLPQAIHLHTDTASLLQNLPTAAPDLFLATWSLSETPAALRTQFIPFLRQAAHLLIAYQSAFGEVDNVTYFAGLDLPHRMVRDYPIPHLPQNRYLIASATP